MQGYYTNEERNIQAEQNAIAQRKLVEVAKQFPDEPRTTYIRIDYNPQRAFLESEFAQDRVASDNATIEDIIVGDVAALVESDGLAADTAVESATELVDLARAFLRYSFTQVSSYHELTIREKTLCSAEQFNQLRTWALD